MPSPHQFPAVSLPIDGVSACFPSFAGFQLFSFSYWGLCPFHSSVSSCSPSVIWISACFLQRFPAVVFQSMAFLPVFIHRFPAVLLQSMGLMHVSFFGFQLFSFIGFKLFSIIQWGFCLFSSLVSSCSPSVNGVSACFSSSVCSF